jgi:uncharacterized membrane protein (DUF485 family)
MTSDADREIERIKNDPQFKELVRKRSAFAWTLSILMLVIYFGFVLTVAFHKELLAQPLAEGLTTTIGIPIGVGVIVSAFILTGIYVARANSTFDDLTAQIVQKVKK